jgi:hypothetical protein
LFSLMLTIQIKDVYRRCNSIGIVGRKCRGSKEGEKFIEQK